MEGGSKAARWAARAAARATTAAAPPEESRAQPPASAPPQQATVAAESSKAARWAARAAAARQQSSQRESLEAAPTATVGTGSKTARWAARAAAAAQSVAPAATPADDGAEGRDSARVHVQGQTDGLLWPAPETAAKGSAMEAWMARAAAKQLHVPWQNKIRDYADEVGALRRAKGLLTADQIRRQRQHLNPPELARTYSSIQAEAPFAPVPGLGWARSCLDSKAAWRPVTPDISQWLQMDLSEEREVLGLVTQGQAEVGCGGEPGNCAGKCSPTLPCRLEGETNYATRVSVKYRSDPNGGWLKMENDLSIGKGGSTRCETPFPAPIRARYLRIFPVDFHGTLALRVGVLVPPRDQLFAASPFALPTMPRAIPADLNDCTERAAAPATSAATSTAGEAARWIAGTRSRQDAPDQAPSPSPSPAQGTAITPVLSSTPAPGASGSASVPHVPASLARIANTETTGQGAHGVSKPAAASSSTSLLAEVDKRLKDTLGQQLGTFQSALPLKILDKLPSTEDEAAGGSSGRVLVWKVAGKAPFVVCFQLDNGDYPFLLQVQYRETDCEFLACSKLGSTYAETAVTGHYDFRCRDNLELEITISVDSRGYHMMVAPHTRATLFYPHARSGDAVAELTNVQLTQYIANRETCPEDKRPGHEAKVRSIVRLSDDQAVLSPPQYEYRRDDWILVFRQTAPFTFCADGDWAEARLLNEHDPTAPNYSILQHLDTFRGSDGLFSFMLHYPDSDSESKRNIWRQSSNPVTMREQGVDDYVPVRVDYGEAHWGGLQRSDLDLKPNAGCFLDGSCEHHEWAFYAIAASQLLNDRFAGPNFTPVHCVELYVSREQLHAPLQEPENENPLCEHGRPKRPPPGVPPCQLCLKPFAGKLITDHCPYLPPVPGHGPRWLWDQSHRKAGGRTLDSSRFFQRLATSPARACQKKEFPALYTPDFVQDACHGYHNMELGDRLRFSGWLVDGLPYGMCSVRWADGTEFHGEFVDGEMTGFGRFIWHDGAEFRGTFRSALPQQGFFHPALKETRRIANYADKFPGAALWQLDASQLLNGDMPERPVGPYICSRCDCLALVHVVPDESELQARRQSSNYDPRQSMSSSRAAAHNFNHIKRVTARLAWARPIHGDQPLWNAEECRGKIVVMMRGPRRPSPACGYTIKVYHAQNAGAVACLFVDYDPACIFTTVPRVETGPIYPHGPNVSVSIPAFLALEKATGTLQEGALHTLTPIDPPPGMQLPPGWVIGNMICLEQESGRTMSKTEEADLMKEFFESRKHEREQEQELLQESLGDLRSGKDRLAQREFIGGGVLDSLSYGGDMDEANAAASTEGRMVQAMLTKLSQNGLLSQDRAKDLAQQAEVAISSLRLPAMWPSTPPTAPPAQGAERAGVSAVAHAGAGPLVGSEHEREEVTEAESDDQEWKRLQLEKLHLLDTLRQLEMENEELRKLQSCASTRQSDSPRQTRSRAIAGVNPHLFEALNPFATRKRGPGSSSTSPAPSSTTKFNSNSPFSKTPT